MPDPDADLLAFLPSANGVAKDPIQSSLVAVLLSTLLVAGCATPDLQRRRSVELQEAACYEKYNTEIEQIDVELERSLRVVDRSLRELQESGGFIDPEAGEELIEDIPLQLRANAALTNQLVGDILRQCLRAIR